MNLKEYEMRRMVRKINNLKPPKSTVSVCNCEACRWKPKNGGRCVLPKCFKGM